MIDSFKNSFNNAYRNVVTNISSVPTESQFFEKGTLTPAEFEAAGDKLCFVSPSWTWKPAMDEAHTFKGLPTDKQYLVTRVVSSERIKEVFNQIEASEVDHNGWIVTTIKEQYKKKYDPDNKVLDQHEDEEPEEMDFDDLDDFDAEQPAQDQAQEDQTAEGKQAQTGDDAEASNVRHYDISITYDRYYYTPRLWLSGVKEGGQPLTNEEIFEDIMSDYINKTVTIEKHPHLSTNQASIHPCRHSEVIHKLVSEARSHGNDMGADQALFIFLKFMNSVLPTLEFDHTTEITLSG